MYSGMERELSRGLLFNVNICFVVVLAKGRICIQLFCGIGRFDYFGNASEHFVEGRVVVHRSSLGVRFLQEPELFESNDGVASGDF